MQPFSTTGVCTSPMGILMNYIQRVCFEQKTFLLASPIFKVFSSKSLNTLVERDKTKFSRSFFHAFFCSSPISKSSVSLLILFSTVNSDSSKLDNLLEAFCFSFFVHFVVHCFVHYLRLFFLFWVSGPPISFKFGWPWLHIDT